MGKYLKIWNLVAKPENHNLSFKTAVKIELEFSRKKKNSFIGDAKLNIDQIKIKMVAKFIKSLFI